MLVWESVFSWLAISKKADLWRHNCKLSDLFYSVTVCPAYTSPGSLILWWLSLPSLLILPPSLTLHHILVAFSAFILFLTCTATENSLVFLFSSHSSTECHMIGFSVSRFRLEVFWPSWSYSMPQKPASAPIPFHKISLPTQMLYPFLKTNTLLLSFKARTMTLRGRRPLKGTLRKKIRSYATLSKKVKKTRKANFFPLLCT